MARPDPTVARPSVSHPQRAHSLAMLALVALGSSPYTGETSAICRAVFGFAEVDSTVFQTAGTVLYLS
eukprot:g77388.t1